MKQKKGPGRPKGPKKVAVNLFIGKERKEKLSALALKEQKTQSILVENALEQTYGI